MIIHQKLSKTFNNNKKKIRNTASNNNSSSLAHAKKLVQNKIKLSRSLTLDQNF